MNPLDVAIRDASGVVQMRPVRATRNWTRVLFTAAAPITPLTEGEMRLRVQGALGLIITGRRLMTTRPVLLETEGF